MIAEARRSLRATRHVGARLMIDEATTPFAGRRLLTRAVYGTVLFHTPGTPTAELLAECEAALAATEASGRAGHWSYDLNRHIALGQARLALRWLSVREAWLASAPKRKAA